MGEQSSVLEVYLQEYDKLKDEQIARIGFRDNLLYVTLGVFGAVISFGISSKFYYSLLIVPWVCLILGWTYLNNDEKVSAIGRYIRTDLSERIRSQVSEPEGAQMFGWEVAHRGDDRRLRRKLNQLAINSVTFFCSGVVSLLAFWWLVSNPALPIRIVWWIELLFMVFLAWEIFVYADLTRSAAQKADPKKS